MRDLLTYPLVLKIIKPFLKAWWYVDHTAEWLLSWYERTHMLKIAVVGDLSMGDADKYDQALSEAFDHADIIIQVGDLHPAYDITNKYKAKGKPFLVVPGNHDLEWDEKFKYPRQWVYSTDLVHIIGLDNSNDHFNDETWKLLATTDLPENKNKFIFVVAHKPLSKIILTDGSESWHYMGEEGGKGSNKKLRDWLNVHKNTLLIGGHYHNWTLQHAAYSDILVEGRGGADPDELGYTLILVNEDGWVLHKVIL